MKRNAEIELWRFLMALVIVNFHFMSLGCCLVFPYGRIGVEFFFLLSGYLLAASVMRQAARKAEPSWKEINDENMSLIARRFVSFFPETLAVAALTCIMFFLIYFPHMGSCLRMMLQSIFGDVFCLRMTGMVEGGTNGAVWYLSTLVLSSAILYPVLRRWGVSLMLLAVGWLLLGSVYLHGTAYDLAGVRDIVGTYKGNIRGFSEMLIGASLFPVTMKIRSVSFSWFGAFVLTAVKWGMGILVFLFAYSVHFFGHNFGIALMAICVLIVLMFSEKCLDTQWYNHPIVLFLGRFSLVLFLSHPFYASYLLRVLPPDTPSVQIGTIYYACSFATAFFIMWVAKYVRGLMSLMLVKPDDSEGAVKA